MRKRLKILLLFDSPVERSADFSYPEEFKKDSESWYVEKDVYEALLANGYDVDTFGLCHDIRPLLDRLDQFQPDVVFNLAEVFRQKSHLEMHVVSLLEMLDVYYTGASSASLFICNNKALSKKILTFHRVKVPHFHTFYRGRRIWLPKSLKLPVVIKPLCEEASRGISQASVVDNGDAFIERIRFIHDNMGMDAIAEEYIDGRELYVTVFGNKKLEIWPPRELKFGQFPEDEPRIATYKAKWDDNYRERWGIYSTFAGRLSNGLSEKIRDVCKRAYRALNLRSYARFDIRVTDKDDVYIIEPNANPCLAKIDEVAQSAQKVGITYNDLIRRIVRLASKRHKK